MSRKVYDDYSYIDPDNLYTYSGTSVLRNNFDERDAEKARELGFGAGMGLPNIQRNASGVEIQSKEGQGTTLKITFEF